MSREFALKLWEIKELNTFRFRTKARPFDKFRAGSEHSRTGLE